METDFKYYVRVDDPDNYNCREIDIEDYRVKRPVVLALGGRGTNSDKDTNGYLKTLGSFLETFKDDIDILGLCYKDGTVNTYFEEINIARFVRNFFLPLVISDDGKRLTREQACKNMQRVRIFAHCFGVEMTNHFAERFEDEMNYVGYNHEEQLEILSQVVMFAYAPYMRNTRFKTVNVISPYDDVITSRYINGQRSWKRLVANYKNVEMSPSDKKYMEELYKDKQFSENCKEDKIGEFCKNNARCFVSAGDEKDGMSIDLICSKLYNNASDHSFKGMRFSKDLQPHEWATETGYYVAKCAMSTLCNAVAHSLISERSEKFIPFDLGYTEQQLKEVVKPLNEGKPNVSPKVIVKEK